MRKKYETLEELRSANARRQREWRARNVVLARERNAYQYGRAEYPGMVEANTREAKRERKAAVEAAPVIYNPSSGEKVLGDGYTYEADPEDCRTLTQKREHDERAARWARKGEGKVEKKEVEQKVVSQVASAENDRALAWLARKKKERGVEVNLE